MKRVTKKSIEKKLIAAGIDMSAIEIASNKLVIVAVMDEENPGTALREETEAVLSEVGKVLGWGGFRCGWGGWHLKPDYEPMGDWNDPSSRHHY